MCAWTDKELFKRTKVEIVGVSSDAVDKQKAFVEKQKLTASSSVLILPWALTLTWATLFFHSSTLC